MAKYRQNKVKRQHHVLSDLDGTLKILASLPAVNGIIPGTIRPKSGGSMGFTFQYYTHSGFKLIGRTSAACQEVFVICQDAASALESLRAAGIIRSLPEALPPNQN